MKNELMKAITQLREHIERQDYKGFDPYDGLKSPLFRLPFLRSSHRLRFLAQQFIKRSRINLRPLLGIKAGTNPVTLGLCIQAYSYLHLKSRQKDSEYLNRIEDLLNRLEKLSAPDFSGHCWGYDFDWEARYARIPAFQPTVVATGIITNALFECWKITGNKRCASLLLSASNFVLHDLNRTYEEKNLCFSYSPFDQQQVLNANMKAARILAQAYAIAPKAELLETAQSCIAFTCARQQKNGSFSYSNKRKQIDNYHTAYILDCLDSCQHCFKTTKYEQELKIGLAFYVKYFFTPTYEAKFYDTETYPLDCTAAGQSLLTLVRFGEKDLAQKIALQSIKQLQDPKGFFYFRKYKSHLIKTNFMRWSDAWMFVGLTYLQAHNSAE